MHTMKLLQILTEDIHSTVIATIGNDGHPITRVIDIMLYDDKGIYFLTAKGKEFYGQLQEQKYVSLSGIKDKRSINITGKVRNIGFEKLDEIFEKNFYMQSIYPNDTRSALAVFQVYEAQGNFFDISDPSHIERGSFAIGDIAIHKAGYFVQDGCIQCGKCLDACPQKCIDIKGKPVIIDPDHCLHCGRCQKVCPVQAIERFG